MRYQLLAAVLAMVLVPASGLANPVSFKDGWGVMPSVSKDSADLEINYSFTNRDAFGVSNFYREGSTRTTNFTLGQYNRLFKRWNEFESQANVYGSAGLGARHDSKLDDSVAGLLALRGDYETRRFLALLEFDALESPGSADYYRIRNRLAVSPYLAPFDALQTWLVVQTEYLPQMDDKVPVTPLVRFFYNNYALEAGASIKGDPFFALMAHF